MMEAEHTLFREWDLYEQIGRANLMKHIEIATALNVALQRKPGPLTVLDLGAGDGHMAYKVFEGSDVVEFQAVDLSESAIQRLAQRPGIGKTPGIKRLICGDILGVIRGLPDRSQDVIHASFSLHHYTTSQKPEVFAQIARILKPDGWLLLTDVLLLPGESREEYFNRLAEHVLETWHPVTPENRQSVVDHIRSSDYPETAEWTSSTLATVGLQVQQITYQDPYYTSFLCIQIAR